jgi:hypothetical protein
VARALFEHVEEPVEVLAVEDEAGALRDRNEMRPPLDVERASLDADVVDGFEVGQAAFHGCPPVRARAAVRIADEAGVILRSFGLFSATGVLVRWPAHLIRGDSERSAADSPWRMAHELQGATDSTTAPRISSCSPREATADAQW